MSDHLLVLIPGQILEASGLTKYLLATLGALFAYLLASYLASPLRQYPGPFLAKFTNLWRTYHIAQGSFHHVLVRLHEKYGPTTYYSSGSSLIDGHIVHTLFSQDDEEKHAAEKKPIAKYYSPASVATLEPLIDKTIAQLCSELDKRFAATSGATGRAFDLGRWILYCSVTFSQPLGYLSAGADFDGTLRAAEKIQDYFAWVGCVPFLDRVLEKNRIVQLFKRPGEINALAGSCVGRLIARYQGADASQSEKTPTAAPPQPDYLDRFIEAKSANPTISDGQIVGWLMINMLAGADTTAISIRSAIYHALRTPGGTVLAFNPYIINRNAGVWGADAHAFRPERWLRGAGEGEGQFAARLRAMNDADLSFGAGSRMCIGKHLGLMQVYKVVATVVLGYEVELVRPEGELRVVNSWFPRQEGLEVRMVRRGADGGDE
ncbi:cytochrome P450 [Chaetomium tenue]|uniref:Cytochrome P450 n=1 Tax=Chaetomium tenue TaxID=1854479 RepID=A0ACB7PHL4_9PEZI|nr:cytochrome P450 [Chaetomium globosum]